jgi:MYXO-CTERM domain-containing protein
VRTIRNRAPVAAGSGDHEVVRGEQLSVTVTVTDPEADDIEIAANDPYVSATSGSSPLAVQVSFQAPADASVGSRTVVNVAATDRGPRPQTTTFSVVFRIVERAPDPAGGDPPSPRGPIDPDTGCVCSTGATALPWVVAVVLWRRRRRRRG